MSALLAFNSEETKQNSKINKCIYETKLLEQYILKHQCAAMHYSSQGLFFSFEIHVGRGHMYVLRANKNKENKQVRIHLKLKN